MTVFVLEGIRIFHTERKEVAITLLLLNEKDVITGHTETGFFFFSVSWLSSITDLVHGKRTCM